MEDKRILNISENYQYLPSELKSNRESSLLEQEARLDELERYLNSQNLKNLDELYSDELLLSGIQHQKSLQEDEEEKQSMQFETLEDQYQQQLNQQQDLLVQEYTDELHQEKLSKTTNESCSTPDSIRNNCESIQYQNTSNSQCNLEISNRKIPIKQKQDRQNYSPECMNEEEQQLSERLEEEQNRERQRQLFQNSSSSYKDPQKTFSYGQNTSNFPLNLEETQQNLRLKDIHAELENIMKRDEMEKNEDQPYHDYNDLELGDEGTVNFNSQGQNAAKIKNFDKSLLIKFEEFQGENTSQPGSDTNRKVYERVSDRIYENTEKLGQNKNENEYADLPYEESENQKKSKNKKKLKKNIQNKQEIPNIKNSSIEKTKNQQQKQQQYREVQEEEEYTEEEQEKEYLISNREYNELLDENLEQIEQSEQNNKEQQRYMNMPVQTSNLFVIAEEDASQIYSEEYHSNYHLNRKISSEVQDEGLLRVYMKEKSLGVNDMRKLSQQYSKSSSDSSSQQRSRSQHMIKRQVSDSSSGQIQMLPTQKGGSYIKQEKNPSKRLYTQEYESQENMSQYIEKRINSQKSNDNVMLYSEEDLLSNVDRISRLLPMNEHLDLGHYPSSSQYDGAKRSQQQQQTQYDLNEDILYYQGQLRRLQDQIENLNILLLMKKEELDSKIEQNYSLEDKIRELEQVILQVGQQNEKAESQDFEVQVNIKSNKKDSFTQTDHKIRPKEGGIISSQSRKSPTRIGQGVGHVRPSSVSQEFQNDPLPPSSNGSRKQSLKQSPQTQIVLSNQQQTHSSHQNVSFNSDDMKTFQQQQQTIFQLKNQLQRADNENLNLLEKTNNIEKLYHELESQLFNLEKDKKSLQYKLDQFQLEMKENERDKEGLKAENHELKKNLESLSQQNSPIKKLEKNLSAINFNNQVSTETQTPPVGQLLNDSYHVEYDQEQFSTFSSKESSKPHIPTNQTNGTPIGQSQSNELQQLLAKAKNYELLSLQLQSEIEDHRKSLKQNQDKQIVKNLHQYKENAQKKLKKKDGEIEKLQKTLVALQKEIEEYQRKIENLQEKNQNMKIKLESKLQEKEFKILSLKQQLKHFATTSGFITPASNGPAHSNVSFSTKQDMLVLINELIKQQIQQQQAQNLQSTQDQSKHMTSDIMNSNVYPYQVSSKQRAKSYENAQMVYKNEENKSKARLSGISAGGGVGVGFGFDNVLRKSSSQWRDNEYINNIISRSHHNIDNEDKERGRTTQYSKGSSNPRYHTPNEGQQNISFEIQKETSQPLKQIFNSSLKRINKELESIKELNSQGKQSSTGFGPTPQNQQRMSDLQVFQDGVKRRSQEKLSFDDSLQDTLKNDKMIEEFLRNQRIMKEGGAVDIVASGGGDQEEDDNSFFLHQFDERIAQLNQKKQDLISQGLFSRRLTEQTAKKTISDLREISWQQNCDDSNSIAFKNFMHGEDDIPIPLPTFQRPQSFKQAQPKRSGIGGGLFQIESGPNTGKNNLIQTQNFEQKEQNESIFYDLKPQFDYSNYSSSSNNDTHLHQHQNLTPNQGRKSDANQFFQQQQKLTELKRYQQSLMQQQKLNALKDINKGSINQVSTNFETKKNMASFTNTKYPNTSQKVKNHGDYTPQGLTSKQNPQDLLSHMMPLQNQQIPDFSSQQSARREIRSGGVALKESCILKKPTFSIQTQQNHQKVPSSINSTLDKPQSQFLQFQQYHSVTHKKANNIAQQNNLKNNTMHFGKQQIGLNYASIKSSSCSNTSSQHLDELRRRYGRKDL